MLQPLRGHFFLRYSLLRAYDAQMTQIYLPSFMLTGLLELVCNAIAASPLIIACGLLAGRRANSDLALKGNLFFGKIAAYTGFIPALYFAISFIIQVRALPIQPQSLLSLAFSPPGMPWTSSAIIACCAWVTLILALGSLRNVLFIEGTGLYSFHSVKKPILLYLASACLFLLSFFLSSYPFAGLPQGLSFGKALFAITRHAGRQFFMALSPAGALAVLTAFIFFKNSELTPEVKRICIRWTSLWAAMGYIPYLVQAWGLLIGISLRSAGPASVGLSLQIANLALCTASTGCWAYLFFKPAPKAAIAIAGALFLLLRPFLPLFL